MDIRPHWTVTDPADEESTGPEARPNSAFLLGWYLDRKFSYDLSGTGGWGGATVLILTVLYIYFV